jgi:hypothetical protein
LFVRCWQFNLFAGSILGLASKEQLPMLEKIQVRRAPGAARCIIDIA